MRARPARIAAAGVAALALTATAAAVPVHADNRTELDWGACPDLDGVDDLPGSERLECAVLGVPLDYADPDGPTIEVAVSRLASTEPDARRGVMLFNPGGPGGPGLEIPVLADAIAAPELTDAYDLIGFDPRGIRYSSPVSCGTTEDDWYLFRPPHPVRGAEDVPERFAELDDLFQRCAAADTEGHLPHISTANTARDMDLIRQALGESQISYTGWSYGSYLGAVYAEMFTEHTDRFVLDSAVGPSSVWHDTFRSFGLGGELTFAEFRSWAAEHHRTYGLGRTPGRVYETYDRIVAALDDIDAEIGDPSQRLGTMVRQGIFSTLYSPHNFPVAAELLAELNELLPGSADAARAILAEHVDTTAPAGAEADMPVDSTLTAQAAIMCGDVLWPSSVTTYQRDVSAHGQHYPAFGAMFANAWACPGWPFEQTEPAVEITDDGPPNILIPQNTLDPATTQFEAIDLAETLGDRARMVVADEIGHGVFLFHANTCANQLTTDFLLGGELPEHDQDCATEIGIPDPQVRSAIDDDAAKLRDFIEHPTG